MTAASLSRHAPRSGEELAAKLRDSAAEAGAAGVSERTYNLAAKPVRLRFAGPALERLMAPALAHLEQPSGRATLTIDVWESAGGGRRPDVALMTAAGAAGEDHLDAPGASYHYRDAFIEALYQPAPDILAALDAEGTHGWFWTGDSSRLPYWDRAAPFRHVVSWWLSRRNVLQLHGGAVGMPEGGVLLVGRGGSGKSTAALSSLVEPRLLYAGDDYVAVATEPKPWVHSLYRSAKVDADNLARVPHVEPLVTNPTRLRTEKAVVEIGGEYRDRLTQGFPLAAIVLAKITPEGPRIVPTSGAAALTALAPSTILQRRPPRPADLAAVRRMTENVPAFVLESGPDPAAIPSVLVALLEDVIGEQNR
jgi:hypothetical protein